MMIDIRNLELTFGTGAAANQVLRGVDLSVAQGEVFGLVGESGCGKSTILRCVAGLYQDWSGEITLAGAQVETQDRSRTKPAGADGLSGPVRLAASAAHD